MRSALQRSPGYETDERSFVLTSSGSSHPPAEADGLAPSAARPLPARPAVLGSCGGPDAPRRCRRQSKARRKYRSGRKTEGSDAAASRENPVLVCAQIPPPRRCKSVFHTVPPSYTHCIWFPFAYMISWRSVGVQCAKIGFTGLTR